MMRYRLPLISFIIYHLSFSHAVAQLTSYDFVKQGDAWLTSMNAAGLTRFSSPDMTQAALSLTHARGGFTDFSESPSVLQADARVESFVRLSPRAVVFGSMSYANFSGRDMGGSAFFPLATAHSPMEASHHPFDIIEDSLGNEGTKHRDVYSLCGAFGIDLWRGLSAGARLDYTSANMAKYKDLRHKTTLMDLHLTAGLSAPVGSVATLGLNYLYHRTTETLLFSTYGKTDRTYVSFINYGPYIGLAEQFAASGYTDRSREMPLVDDADGVALQLDIHTPQPSNLNPQTSNLKSQPTNLHFYQQLAYARRRGYYGRRSPYTATLTRHRSRQYRYDASLMVSHGSSRYHLDLTLQAENLENQANIFRELQNDAGATYYEYYTPLKTADRLWVSGTAAFTAHWGISQSLPAWTLRAGLNWDHRKQTAYLYPYYRRQRLTAREPFCSLTRQMPMRRGLWTLQADAAIRQGSDGGEPYVDATFTTPSDKAVPPATMDAYCQRELQWLCAPQYAVGAAVKYSFMLPSTSLKTSAALSLRHRKCNAPRPYSAGRDRTTATITLGCEL